MNLKKTKLVAILSFLLFSTIAAFSQPSDPGGGPGGGDPPVGAGVPLDGGAIGLLIVGAIYGANQLKNKKYAE